MRELHSKSDAESISTTTSQDSRGSNKENNRPDDDPVIVRKKADYSRVCDMARYSKRGVKNDE